MSVKKGKRNVVFQIERKRVDGRFHPVVGLVYSRSATARRTLAALQGVKNCTYRVKAV